MRRFFGVLAALVVGAAAARAGDVTLDGPLMQGALVTGRVAPGLEVVLNDRPLRVAPDGLFVIGFGRDAGPLAELLVRYPDGRQSRHWLEIASRTYETQAIDGLPENMVSPSAEELERIRREAALIAGVRARDSARAWFAEGFAWPLIGIITGVYGSQRILNGEPRRPHYGVDIAGPVGAPVRAPAPGVVALAEPDLFFTGGTVMLDHGHGVTSVFSHLSEVSVAVGAEVRTGEVIGLVGATGRVTGPHLDWRVNWFEERLDPALLVGPMPSPVANE